MLPRVRCDQIISKKIELGLTSELLRRAMRRQRRVSRLVERQVVGRMADVPVPVMDVAQVERVVAVARLSHRSAARKWRCLHHLSVY